jgi:lipoprotein NlpD
MMAVIQTPRALASVRLSALMAALLLTGLLTGCAVKQGHRAPVEDRTPVPTEAPAPDAPPSNDNKASAAEPPRPGQYTVKTGDTLIRIALDQGLSWRDLARWNGLDNPNLLEVGQVLRVVPPGSQEQAGTRPVGTPKVEARPLESKPAVAAAPAAVSSSASAPAAASAVAPPPAVNPAAVVGEGELNWSWPAAGGLLTSFDETKNKGLAIGGKAGDSVLAAADGRVMYAGAGLRGYGNMVIIKHNETYLSAYAHNQTLLVKEDQVVRKGQAIAEMGSSDADQVKLHFEIRRKGKPIDPARLLPAR